MSQIGSQNLKHKQNTKVKANLFSKSVLILKNINLWMGLTEKVGLTWDGTHYITTIKYGFNTKVYYFIIEKAKVTQYFYD